MTIKTDSPKDPGASSKPDEALLQQLKRVINQLRADIFSKFKRHVSINDLLSDRWETARFYGFGEGTSCYNNVLILGDVKVGKNTWIGPNVVLDGSGGLEIGSYVSVSCGVQIYTHHTVEWSTSLGQVEASRKPTKIGDGVYIGPNSIIQMGVSIGDGAIIGAMSFVNRDVPAGAKFYGAPARQQG
ncbi:MULTISPECIES: acyltransferase [Pseudomonas]|uniref:acyltransferase n=1 Tax=Pseudomonas TaxID=286 RepID=UPI0008B63111|nr:MULTISPECIES: acyltransferase [Pseudomonas]MBP5100089.1 acyltransferase [Pseudomonas protegens]MBP5116469.1 acyltransferase [Pseudomonas protegens]MBP5127075.1 acyltransferase [Pseudomonas protegens]POA90840.1 acyltransferase [Pseudomonas protegens]QTU08836.1 acyltransferase [Pseudomonas protegens]